MAYRRIILNEAQREYRSIVAYLAETLGSEQAALHFIEEFDRQFALVAENPFLHALSRMPELAARGYRSMLVGSYLALHKIDGDAVVIAHVFHQSQDYANLV